MVWFLLSFFNFEADVPFFCGGIPDIFGILKSYEEFIPDNMHRIADKRFSFKEYLITFHIRSAINAVAS